MGLAPQEQAAQHSQVLQQLEAHRSGLSSTETQFLTESLHIFRGYCWTIDAIALYLLKQGVEPRPDTFQEAVAPYLEKILPRISEIMPEMAASHQLQSELLGYPVYQADGSMALRFDQNSDPHGRILSDLYDAVREQAAFKEQFRDVEIIMIAGHQGSGKDTLAEYLRDQHGFQLLGLSSIVSEVATVWGLDSTGTTDKIVTGQVFKEYFGPDILIQLGVAECIREGNKRIVIVGPRVIEEVHAAKELGAKVVAVKADADTQKDSQLRRQRIVHRAAEGNRPQDVEKFDEREAIESGRVNQILELADVSIINDYGTKEEFYTSAAEKLLPKQP
jgi:dephospho-CoA kinase